jgi:putative endonuclease
MPWSVYILRCRDESLYTGVTNDLDSRVAAHQAGRGARYTASRCPVTMVYNEPAESKSAALKRELQIKRWSKAKKEALIKGDDRRLSRLSKCRAVHGKDR